MSGLDRWAASGNRTKSWQPGGPYNATIAPLTPYAIRGAIWYQGESDTDAPAGYGRLFAH